MPEALRTVVLPEVLRAVLPEDVLPLRTAVPEAVFPPEVREAPALVAEVERTALEAEDALRVTLVAELRDERTAEPAEAVLRVVARTVEPLRLAELLRVTPAELRTVPDVREVLPPRPSRPERRVVALAP